MTRHVTDPEAALARAKEAVEKLSSVQGPSLLRDAYETGASMATTGARALKTAAGHASTVANIGAGGYSALGVPAVQVVGSTLGAVGNVLAASPVGLALAGVNAAYHLKAVYSTEWHIRALDAISRHADTMEGRTAWQTGPRTLLALYYTLAQKSEKSIRRGLSAVPGLGLFTTVYGIGRSIYKRAKGTKGKARDEHTRTLIQGLKGSVVQVGGRSVYRPDYLAYGTVIELLGEDDFWYAVGTVAKNDWDGLYPALFPKLAST